MKILVVGGGGREHAIIKSLKKSPRVSEIYAAPGNGGIAADAICTGIGAKDLDAIAAFAKDNAIDFAVVAPDDPLVLGAVDRLEAIGIPCFGPKQGCRHPGGQQGLLQGPHEEIPHPHRRVRRL